MTHIHPLAAVRAAVESTLTRNSLWELTQILLLTAYEIATMFGVWMFARDVFAGRISQTQILIWWLMAFLGSIGRLWFRRFREAIGSQIQQHKPYQNEGGQLPCNSA